MTYTRSLLIFRRDLRLEDNTALIRALASSHEVHVVFIFDPRQCEPHDYFSPNAFQFLRASLDELAGEVKELGGVLERFYGRADEVVAELLRVGKFDAVHINKDYTPFSRNRDAAIKKVCRDHGAAFEEYDDALLCPPGSVMKEAGGPYAVFTPFYKKAEAVPVRAGTRTKLKGNFVIAGTRTKLKGNLVMQEMRKKLPFNFVHVPVANYNNKNIAVKGGRKEAMRLLANLKGLRNYARERDIPALDATSHLSAHLKFGTLSVREVFHAAVRALGPGHPLLEQLYWRDFFVHVGYYYPHVFSGCFYDEYDAVPWENDKKSFARWCEGRTGVPIVDAGMRELNTTGFMHNRVRMIAASFLVKDLHVDWRWGERYFATRLVDYDPAVNNGNWQWVASTGCDHQPYFRVFNPWLQQKRFDPDGAYVRKWVLELKNAAAKDIFDAGPQDLHSDAAAWVKEAFKDASRRGKIV